MITVDYSTPLVDALRNLIAAELFVDSSRVRAMQCRPIAMTDRDEIERETITLPGSPPRWVEMQVFENPFGRWARVEPNGHAPVWFEVMSEGWRGGAA